MKRGGRAESCLKKVCVFGLLRAGQCGCCACCSATQFNHASVRCCNRAFQKHSCGCNSSCCWWTMNPPVSAWSCFCRCCACCSHAYSSQVPLYPATTALIVSTAAAAVWVSCCCWTVLQLPQPGAVPAAAAAGALTLSPSARMADAGGPTKMMPSSLSLSTKPAFSDRKP